MGLGDESTRGRASAGTESASLGAVSLGLASVVLATGASAQQSAEPAAELPPLEVTAKKAAKKKTAAKKAATPAASPAPQAYQAEPSSGPTPDEQTNSFTPASGNSLQAGTGMGRLPGTIQDTPQIVNVVPAEQLKQQNVATVEQSLRSVPGVTIAIGEGNGGLNGDQFRIRGFEAKTDLYVDGLRDFGVYVRDSFATEEVQVLKGPSSESFGSGTTGGAINLRQKSAHLGDASNVTFSVGTDDYYRATLDINKQVNSTTAMRGVAMYHSNDVPDRDHVDSERWGFLGSIGFGLGTDTTWIVNYLHQKGDQKPDMGVPGILATGSHSGGKPVTELGVDRSAYYGRAQDHDETEADIITSRFQTKVSSAVTFYNDTRLAFYNRDFSGTIPGCANMDASTPSMCADNFLAGTNPNVAFGGGNPTYRQDNWGFQNISSAVARFKTGFLRHEAVAGVDVFYQENDRAGYTVSGKTANSPIENPGIRYHDRYTVTRNRANDRFMDGTEVGLFASDRVWFTPELSVLGGIRWTHFDYSYAQPYATTPIDRTSEGDYWSPKVSVIWEPTKQQTYYFSWATSATPLGAYVGNAAQPITNDLYEGEVEEHESFELGAKFSLLGDRLAFTAAVFQVDKDNAVVVDPSDPTIIATNGEKQRVRGVELGVAGQLTKAWAVNAAVTFMDSEIRDGATAANIGNEIGGVPDTAISFWTTYNLSDSIISGPGTWLVGGGIFYQSEMYFVNNSANEYELPETFSLDAMVSYELDGWRFALNGYNLTDELYYSSSFGNRATPAAGRSAIFSIGKSF